MLLFGANLFANPVPAPVIVVIDPPEDGFFSKRLDYEGIPIKAHKDVVDQALVAARERLAMMLCKLPLACEKLRVAGVELHIIGRHQVTTDLPEWRHDKGKHLAEYNGLTRDERTRGMGGMLTSCGEENLLKLEDDRYRGRDICVHEFAHCVFDYGAAHGTREKFEAQLRRSLAKGLWVESYAGSNVDEFFAELTMWYFGTHGDMGMKGAKPADGRDGLIAYDPEAFALLDEFYSGRMEEPLTNLAPLATPSTSFVSGHETLGALNDGFDPGAVNDHSHGAYGNWPQIGTQWVQYDWSQPISTRQADVYWWDDSQGVRLPKLCRLLYWDGGAFVPVRGASGLGVDGGRYNTTTFDEVTTSKLRLEFDGSDKFSTGIIEWKVLDSGKSPAFPPVVSAGVDRLVVTGGKTWLAGVIKQFKSDGGNDVAWSKTSGPGEVVFADAHSPETTATFTAPGEYVLQLTAGKGALAASSSLKATVMNPPPAKRLDVVYTKHYRIDSPLWNARTKALIVNWIPHCIDMINRTDLKEGQGGIDNFVESAKALRGEPHARHKGYVFANAWVHQTVESMCLALMVDPQGDAAIITAQTRMKATLEDWIPKILAAQEPDGYLQTAYTLADHKQWPERWSPAHRGDHEGYVAGYFIESAINHYTLTNGTDKRLYDAAKKLADCWVANLGPGKKEWFDGHQEMEQALVRFGRFVNDMEGKGRGDEYVKLARYLLDARRGGDEYDQSHLPPVRQYEAVGHAVRAVYNYSAMADIAAETGDRDYESAVLSLWDNLVNKKYYVTGGVGSGETSEGFGGNFSLPNDAYCESCSSCGLIFFQYKLNIAYHDAKYADLYEETIYNALLGATDLVGKNFMYTNPLVGGERGPWHVCPCCVGNIPRTLLMIPTWTYVKDDAGLYVNLFIGSSIKVENVAGTDVEMVQKTAYPWSGRVAITVNPAANKTFAVRVRVPDRATSKLYTSVPQVGGLKSLAVNGQPLVPEIVKGYAVINREWKAGDTITLELPMQVQRITADPRIEADRGRTALRYGPLIYNVETADQPDIERVIGDSPLTAEWKAGLLGGVMAVKGTWKDGSPLLAIPHFARLNRSDRVSGDGEAPAVDYSGGAAARSGAPKVKRPFKPGASMVWIRSAE